MRNRRIIVAAAALGFVAVAVRQPTADIQILTHETADPAPHRVQAAVNLGLVGVKLLYTWTSRLR